MSALAWPIGQAWSDCDDLWRHLWAGLQGGGTEMTVHHDTASGVVPSRKGRPVVSTFAGYRLLLVEDGVLAREILQEMLQNLGVEVDVAENGQEAVARASTEFYDLILMDIRMPVMDGILATRLIRRLPGYGRTPILALTAHESDAVHQQGREAGINDFFCKPISKKTVETLLSTWVDVGRMVGDTSKVTPTAWRIGAVAIPDIDATNRTVVETDPLRYMGFLLDFVGTYSRSMSRLRGYVMAGAMIEARELVAALRGSSGLIGVSGIEKLAADLEHALAQGESEMAVLLLAHEIEQKLDFIRDAATRHAAGNHS